jgi:hypothetical protein
LLAEHAQFDARRLLQLRQLPVELLRLAAREEALVRHLDDVRHWSTGQQLGLVDALGPRVRGERYACRGRRGGRQNGAARERVAAEQPDVRDAEEEQGHRFGRDIQLGGNLPRSSRGLASVSSRTRSPPP